MSIILNLKQETLSTEMEAIETRSDSPSGKTRSSSRLSNQENSNDSDGKDPAGKRKTTSSTRKGKIIDKEKEEIDVEANGNACANETLLTGIHSIEETEIKDSNLKNDFECENSNVTENGNQNNVLFENSVALGEFCKNNNNKNDGSNDDAAEVIDIESKDEKKSANDEVQIDNATLESSKIVLSATENNEINENKKKNNNGVVDAEESYFTAESASKPMERTDNSEITRKDTNIQDEDNLESNSDLPYEENENDMEHRFVDEVSQIKNNQNLMKDVDESSDLQNIENLQNYQTLSKEIAEPKKGFFGKWNFRLTIDKKESETNGHSSLEEINRANLYYSSIKGRLPLKGSPYLKHEENTKDSNLLCKTPSNTRNLDDSFGVKSEPSRSNRGEIKDKSNLRKFPAKRCLNADESDDKDENFLSDLNFPKRRKLDQCESRSGFLRNFLWSPFRKKNSCDRMEGNMEESTDKNQISKSSWFRSPFWFWKRCNKEESN